MSVLRFLSTIHIPGLSGVSARQDEDEFREKLIALLEGMECQNSDELIARGKVDDYRKLGEFIANQIKLMMMSGEWLDKTNVT